jgi:hypothetical protein
MSWTMNVNPFGNLALSALVALVPILFLFIALTVSLFLELIQLRSIR